MILLSLCIPTYNRARFLGESLPAIFNSVNPKYFSEIEIVISDNASTDDTQSVIANFQKENSNFFWNVIRQNSNIGPSNVTVVTTYAKGEFIWILSDDDIVMPDAVNRILEKLHSEPNLNGVVVNYAPFKDNIKYLKKAVLPLKEQPRSPDEFLSFLSSQLTFISILVFRRNLSFIPEDERRFYSLCQCFIFLNVIKQKNISYIPQTSLAVRGNNSGGYNFFTVFVGEFEEILRHATDLGFGDSYVNEARAKHLPFLLRFSIGSRLNEIEKNFDNRRSEDRKIVYKNYGNKPISIMIQLALSSPDWLYDFVRTYIWKKIKSR